METSVSGREKSDWEVVAVAGRDYVTVARQVIENVALRLHFFPRASLRIVCASTRDKRRQGSLRSRP